jgi:hypothetical protein
MFRQILIKLHNIGFDEDPLSCSRVVTCRQMAKLTGALLQLSVGNALKSTEKQEAEKK